MILIRKTNGKITKEKISATEANKIGHCKNRSITHLCWEGNCPVELCNANTCPKVFDIEKKHIEDYDFIISGVQAYKETGDMDYLLVQECTLYNKYMNEHPEQKSKVRVKK